MAQLNIPNNIVDGALIEAIDHQQNYQEIEAFINGEIIHSDGSKAMNVGAELLLGAVATASMGAATKSQVDAAITTAADELAVGLISAEGDATAKADAAVVTANAYTDSVVVETDFTTDIAGGQLVTTSTPQIFLDTGSFTNTKAGVYIVTATVDVLVNTLNGSGQINAFVGELFVDDVAQSNTMVWHPMPPTLGTRLTVSQVWIVSAPAGNTLDFKLKVWQAAGNDGSYLCDGSNHSFLSALFVG